MFQIPSFDPTYILPDAPAPEQPPLPPLRRRRIVDVPPEAPSPVQMALPPLVPMDPTQSQPATLEVPGPPITGPAPIGEMPEPMPLGADGGSTTRMALPPLRPRMVPDVEVGDPNPTDETRDRYIGDERQRQIDNREKYLHDPAYSNAPENKPGRLKSFGTGALLSAGQAADDILAGSRRSGQAVTWGDVGQIAAGAFGGGAAGAVKPKLIADLEHQSEIARLKGEQAEERVKRQQAIDEAAKRAAIGHTIAQTNDLNAQPEIERHKREDKIAEELRKQEEKLNETLAEPFTDPKTGKMWIRYKNDPSRQTPFTINGEQVQLEKDPTTGQYLKPEEIARNSATRAATLATVGNANAGFDQQWEIAEREREEKRAAADSEADGLYAENDTLGQRNAAIAEIMKAPHTRQVINPQTRDMDSYPMSAAEFADSPEGRQLQQEFAANEAKGKANLTKAGTLRAKANTLNKPTPRRAPNQAPKPTTVTGRDAAKKYFKSVGVPDDKLDAAVDDYLKSQ